jgi:hypothetical protein
LLSHGWWFSPGTPAFLKDTHADDFILFFFFPATFSNISALSWRPVLVVEEAGVPGENHQPWESNW